MTAWSLPLPDRTEWRPEQRGPGGTPTHLLTPGTLVVWERAPYRVLEINERDPHDWPEKYTERWLEHGCPDPATWSERPLVLIVRHEPEPDAKPVHLLARASHWWTTLPEHYSVCRLCGELPPCREVHTETVMADAAQKMDAVMSILPGCCHACREPVTRRQKTIRFEGANLIRPDLPDGSAIFHLRESCHYSAQRYDARWAVADPARRRKLYCEGRGRHHYDGSFDCTDPECPGKPPTVGHRSEEWHTLDGTRRGYTSGCWCVSGDLAARLTAEGGQW